MMNYIKLLLIFLLLNSCTKKYTSVNEYERFSVKFLTTKISYPTNDFSISIPQNWIWKVEKYNTKQILLGIDAAMVDSTNGFTRILSVQKYKSAENNADLKKEYESSLKLFEKNDLYSDIVETGKTKLNGYDAYFVHTKSDHEQSLETVTYIVKSKEDGIFYSLTASCQIQDNPKVNMRVMIKCLHSFEFH